MPDDTDILGLPLILPNQAQKHVTHNEALAALDVIVQLAVISRSLTVPPALAGIGDRYIVPAGATVEWAGQAGKVAVMTETGWQFHAPNAGWRAEVLGEGQTAVFDGLAWQVPSEGEMQVARLGVSADPDPTNRLSVSSPATLLNHAGAGHQLKLNKALAGDTASLLFQTGFSGRAEMGTTGSDAFQIKVSADGSAFQTALTADPATGRAGLPAGCNLAGGTAAAPALTLGDAGTGVFRPAADQLGLAAAGVVRAVLSAGGLQLSVPVTGTAVTQGLTDSTPGRLMKVGDFGLGGVTPVIGNASVVDNSIVPGFYNYDSMTGSTGGPAGVIVGLLIHFRRTSGGGETQTLVSEVGSSGAGAIFTRSRTTGGWTAWRAGGGIERGANANGEFMRCPDGTQICWRNNLSAANASTADGALFRSANVGWTFPVAFSAAPSVSGAHCSDADCFVTFTAPSTSAVTARVRSTITKAAAITFGMSAVGRWY